MAAETHIVSSPSTGASQDTLNGWTQDTASANRPVLFYQPSSNGAIFNGNIYGNVQSNMQAPPIDGKYCSKRYILPTIHEAVCYQVSCSCTNTPLWGPSMSLTNDTPLHYAAQELATLL
jgi:hypothetical protein